MDQDNLYIRFDWAIKEHINIATDRQIHNRS